MSHHLNVIKRRYHPVLTIPIITNNFTKMTAPSFHFNTVLICYNCRRQAIVYIRQSDKNQHTLNLRFVSCGVCARFPHVFNPITSLRKGYIDVQSYSDIIDGLKDKFRRTPFLSIERGFFSLARLRNKTMARIEDCNRLRIEGGIFSILDHEEGCKFFYGEPASLTMMAAPAIRPQDDDSFESGQILNPIFVEPPPPYTPASSSNRILLAA